MTDNDEGKYVADTIQEQRLRNHYNNRDFAILYRTNAQSRAFEESLRRMAIPYTMFGGVSFYQRKEIKDFLAYLRIIVNPRDEEGLKRIINYPTRGIGKTSIDRAVLEANNNKVSLWEVLERGREFGYKGGTLEAIDNFVLMIRSFASMLETKNAYEVAAHVGKQTNLVKDLFNDKTTEGLARYENIQELLNSIKEFTERPDDDGVIDTETKGLGNYLQQISLVSDADEKDPNADTVKLMSIHAAKGLEFSCVFAAGLEEMLFPNAMSINTREELEEERRLFYVVVTRAKERLWITYANTRYRFGNLVQNEPSRFIEEIPSEFMDRSFAGGGVRNQGSGPSGAAYDRMHGGGFGGPADQAEKTIRTAAPQTRRQTILRSAKTKWRKQSSTSLRPDFRPQRYFIGLQIGTKSRTPESSASVWSSSMEGSAPITPLPPSNSNTTAKRRLC